MLDDMCDRLMKAARDAGLTATARSELASRRFRGSDEDSETPSPVDARGLMLGNYPVLAIALPCSSASEVDAAVKAAHSQMIIARSYLTSGEVIDAHIFFVALTPRCADWVQLVDAAERNETVCRKLVWVPDDRRLDASFNDLAERTFLTRPWRNVEERDDAPLDQNEWLVESVLREKGLGKAGARKWVELAAAGGDDAEALVDQLVEAMYTPEDGE